MHERILKRKAIFKCVHVEYFIEDSILKKNVEILNVNF